MKASINKVTGLQVGFTTEWVVLDNGTWRVLTNSEKALVDTEHEVELAQQLEDAKPKVISPLQARLALNEMLLRKTVEDSMLTATQDVKDFYEFALEWKRDNAQLLAMATGLGMDSKAIDDFFMLASSK